MTISRLNYVLQNTQDVASIYCGTIHSFCYNALTRYMPQEYGNLRVFSDVQQLALLNVNQYKWELGKVNPARYASAKGPYFSALAETIDIAKLEELETDANLVAAYPEFFRVIACYQEYLRSNERADFTDLILLAVRQIDSNPEFAEKIRARSRWLFVDEYQDVDPAQHRLITTLSAENNLCVVGDDDQSIYQFRGTDPRHFVSFYRDTLKSQSVVLDTNFRCRENIGRTAKEIVSAVTNRIDKPMTFFKKGGYICKKQFDTLEQEAAFISGEIKRLKADGLINTYGDVAILLRSVSSHGRIYIDSLRSSGIPLITRGDRGLFYDPVVQLVCAVVEFIAHPDDSITCLLEVAPIIGLDMEVVSRKTSEYSVLSDQDLENAGASYYDVHRLRKWEQIRTRYRSRKFTGFIELIHDIIATLEVLKPDDNVLACCNLGVLTHIVKDFDEIAQTKNLLFLCGFFRMYSSTMADEAKGDKSVDAVSLITVHQAKGLEFSTVFLPMLCKGRFPLERQNRPWLLPAKAFDSKRYLGGIDDERRLFYVAATRAADRLYLSYAQDVGTARPRSPSVFYERCEAKPGLKQDKVSTPRGGVEAPLSLSYSSLELYLSCPFRYRLAKEIGIATPENPFFEFGRILHYVARRMHEVHSSGRLLTPRDIEGLYEDSFHIHMQIPQFTIMRRKMAGIGALKSYYGGKQTWFDNMHAVEKPFHVVDGNAILRGQYDLLVKDDDGMNIIDFKTGTPHDYINTHLQVMLYSWAAAETLCVPVKQASILYMESDREVIYRPTAKDLAAARNTFLDAVDCIRASKFAPSPGDTCTRCEYRKICPNRRKDASK